MYSGNTSQKRKCVIITKNNRLRYVYENNHVFFSGYYEKLINKLRRKYVSCYIRWCTWYLLLQNFIRLSRSLLSLLQNYVALGSFRVMRLLHSTRNHWDIRNVDKSNQRNSLSWASNRKIRGQFCFKLFFFKDNQSAIWNYVIIDLVVAKKSGHKFEKSEDARVQYTVSAWGDGTFLAQNVKWDLGNRRKGADEEGGEK
jgi:hypothetical protein